MATRAGSRRERSITRRIRNWIAPPAPDFVPEAPTLDDVRRQVRLIEVRARRAMRDALSGDYRTAFRGRGLEFAELRPYNPGDDVRAIDWKATARLRAPVMRRYVEEREQTVLLLVDVSASTGYAATGTSVRERSVEIAGVLGLAAADANDVVGAAAFATDVVLAVPPAKGAGHMLRIVRDLLTLAASGRTELARALRYAGRVMPRRGVIIVISDFIKTHPDHVWEPELARLSRRHDVVAICVRDARESSLARAGIVQWGGAERGDVLLADWEASQAQQRALEQERREILSRLRGCGCDAILVDTDEDWLPVVAGLFRQRRGRP